MPWRLLSLRDWSPESWDEGLEGPLPAWPRRCVTLALARRKRFQVEPVAQHLEASLAKVSAGPPNPEFSQSAVLTCRSARMK